MYVPSLAQGKYICMFYVSGLGLLVQDRVDISVYVLCVASLEQDRLLYKYYAPSLEQGKYIPSLRQDR